MTKLVEYKKYLEKKLKKKPNDVDLLLKISFVYYKMGKNSMHLKTSKKAFRIAPCDCSVLWNYASALNLNWKGAQAIRIYKSILRKREDMKLDSLKIRAMRIDAYYRIGLSYQDLRKWDLAIKWVKKFISTYPKGKALKTEYTIEQGKTKLARLQARKKSEINIRKIEKAYDRKQYRKALKLLLEEQKNFPKDLWTLTMLSSVIYELRDYKKALSYAKKALKLDGNEIWVLWHYAGALDMLKRDAEAIRIYKRIMTLDNRGNFSKKDRKFNRETVNDSRYRIGACYFDMQKDKAAERWLKLYLLNRKPGIKTNYTRADVEQMLKDMRQH